MKRVVHLGDVDLLCPPDKEEGADDGLFWNTVAAEMAEEGDKYRATDVLSDHSINAAIWINYV